METTVRDERRVPFAMIEIEVLRDPTLSSDCKVLYSLLVSYGPEHIFPSQTTLAEQLGACRASVNRWCQELRDRGLIDWAQREGTSNLYIILGPGKCRTGGTPELQGCDSPVTPRCDRPVTRSRSSLSRSTQPDPHDAIASAPTKPTDDVAPVQEVEQVDDQDQERDCEQCGSTVYLYFLKHSAAACPMCGHPFRVRDCNGRVIKRPPQSARAKKVNTPWLPAVEAFCERAGLDWKKVSGTVRGQWARQISLLCPEQSDPQYIAQVILDMDIYDSGNLSNPYQDRFAHALTNALAGEQGATEKERKEQELEAYREQQYIRRDIGF